MLAIPGALGATVLLLAITDRAERWLSEPDPTGATSGPVAETLQLDVGR